MASSPFAKHSPQGSPVIDQSPRWLRRASSVSLGPRRVRSGSWSFLWTSLASILVLGLFVLAYNESWRAALVFPSAGEKVTETDATELPDLHKILPSNDPQPEPVSSSNKPPQVHLVLSSYRKQNVSWVADLPKLAENWRSSWTVFRYMSDVPEEQLKNSEIYEEMFLENDQGRESLAYLTYIVDNYRNLPDVVIFVHGHKFAWHQPENIADKVVALNTSAVIENGYINLRCALFHGCESDDVYWFGKDKDGGNAKGRFPIDKQIFKAWWQTYLREEFGGIPDKIQRRCCSQFAVSRENIQKRPLKYWKKLQAMLLSGRRFHGVHRHQLGQYFEMTWHIIMGMPPVHCPDKQICEQVFFRDKIHCLGNDEYFRPGLGTKGGGWALVTCYNEMREGVEGLQPLEGPDANYQSDDDAELSFDAEAADEEVEEHIAGFDDAQEQDEDIQWRRA